MQENAFENIISQIVAILSGPQGLNVLITNSWQESVL